MIATIYRLFRGPDTSELLGLGLAILLSVSAGAVDTIAYLQFNHVFVANMTGNTVLFASNLIFHQVSAAIAHLLPILGFVAGIVTARLLVNRNAPKENRPSPASGLCFLLASGLWTIIGVLTPSLTRFLIPVLAFSMGAQNAAFTRIGKTPVNTAFITGTWRSWVKQLPISYRFESRTVKQSG